MTHEPPLPKLILLCSPAIGDLCSPSPESVCDHKKTSLPGWLLLSPSLPDSPHITFFAAHLSCRYSALCSVAYSNSKLTPTQLSSTPNCVAADSDHLTSVFPPRHTKFLIRWAVGLIHAPLLVFASSTSFYLQRQPQIQIAHITATLDFHAQRSMKFVHNKRLRFQLSA